MITYGLIGKNLSHSFSATYFQEKFLREKISKTQYLNFELKHISEFPKLIEERKISGLNVTIPYKEKIIPFLDNLTDSAKSIGAVNTIEMKENKLIGHNTDIIGFTKGITPMLGNRNKALILGNGGSAKAVKHALNKLNIEHKTVSRKTSFNYSDITPKTIGYYDIIINTTPIGMYPEIDKYPQIPYQYLNKKHLLYDLIYNPVKTLFLYYGEKYKCEIKNGLDMLQIQAEESWSIWTL
tara:strand:+ start:1257 stop:1973 length:717 start_codon:yes stop_codon:yes gene_type:complete